MGELDDLEGTQPESEVKKTTDLMEFFKFDHLPKHLQDVSMPFCDLAVKGIQMLPANSQRTHAIESLLDAKDRAVRSLLMSKKKD